MNKTKHVLVMLSADGFVEVFADKDIVATVINRPVANSAKQGIQVEELIDSILPRSYKDIHWPGNRICSGKFERTTPNDIMQTVQEVSALNQLGDSTRQRYRDANAVMFARLGGGGGRRANTCPMDRRKEEKKSAEKAQAVDTLNVTVYRSRKASATDWSKLI